MTHIDVCLVADTKEDLITALPWARKVDDAGVEGWRQSGSNFAFDAIGAIVTQDGTYAEDGSVLTPPVIDNRYHANLRTWGDFTEVIDPALIVHPVNLRREFAGSNQQGDSV